MSNLVEIYKEMHKDENLYAGSALTLHKESIQQYLSIKQCQSILDYGCGKGIQYSKEKIHENYFYGIMPSLYDPAVEQFSKLPKGKFDAVICTDVFEHVEEEHLEKIIKEIYSKANKFVYLGVCNSLADSFLPDGRNSHVTLHSIDWWIDKILPHVTVHTLLVVYGDAKSQAILDNKTVVMKKIR
jgi:cyclopropane fatty-acyl-phospholipid synthase-like methyltransferase